MPGSNQALTYNNACSLCTLPQRPSFPMSLGSDSALSTARLTVGLRAVLLLLEVCLSLIVFFSDTTGARERNHITKYPTIKVYRRGVPLKSEYRGQRSPDAIAAYVRELLAEPVLTVNNNEEVRMFHFVCFLSLYISTLRLFRSTGTSISIDG